MRTDAEPQPGRWPGRGQLTWAGRGRPARNPALKEFRKNLREKLALLKMDESFATRYVNDGFSGGEKKRLEVLQMAMLKPKVAMLDEPDSGLDIDAVRVVAEGVNSLRGPEMGILMVTHYQRILNYIKPDYVHVMINGRIVRSGGPELAQELEVAGLRLAAHRLHGRDAEDRTDDGGERRMTTPSTIEHRDRPHVRRPASPVKPCLPFPSATTSPSGCASRASKAGRLSRTCPMPTLDQGHRPVVDHRRQRA